LAQGDKPLDKLPEDITKAVIFNDEAEMLESLFEVIEQYPLIITFNGDDFDLKYLYYRALRLGVPYNKIPISVKKRICTLRRGIHIDLYKFFFIQAMRVYAFKAKYKDVDLDTVARALLGKGKIKGEEKWVAKMSYYDLVKYCMNDAEITLELTTFNDNLVMNLMMVLERMSRMPIINVTRKSVSSWIRSFMLYEHRQRNILIPTPEEIKAIKGEIISEAIIKGKKYKGAIVFNPVVGTHFLVLVLDFASLYPSIIKVYNIGYSTINCPHEECKSNTIGELTHWICKKHRSLESLLIGSLRDLRVFWYKKRGKDDSLEKSVKGWYSVAEQSIKVIMNASYGVFGAESFMFYCPPVAEEVTSIARYIIEQTALHAQEMGMEVLYGDTDSIFIKKPPEEQLQELIKWTYDTYGIEFDVDKTYRYVCLSDRKKNYFGVTIKGDVDVKGLTGKKKHTPPIIKKAFEDTKIILSEIKSPEEMEIGKQNIVKLIKEVYFTFKNRTWDDISDLEFSVTMNNPIEQYTKTTPQHVKAAKLLIAQGYDIGAGSVIKFVKTNKKFCGTSVKPIETAKKNDIDVTKYTEYLKSTFEQVLDPMNVSFEHDILGVTKMDRWMK
jgi:DNA polymerase I